MLSRYEKFLLILSLSSIKVIKLTLKKMSCLTLFIQENTSCCGTFILTGCNKKSNKMLFSCWKVVLFNNSLNFSSKLYNRLYVFYQLSK